MRSEPVQLATLARRVGGELRGDGAVAVTDVTHDSRRAVAGSLFVAVRGLHVDGHAYAGEAAARGASALLVEGFVPSPLPQIRVSDTRRAVGPAASLVNGDPSRRLDVIGVTGTNGKTTVTMMIESIALAAGRSCGRLGTLGATIMGRHEPLVLTTPEASDLQRLFRRMVCHGLSLAAMEVSSHALALDRVGGTSFAVAAFTNLSQDHLDFHGNMEGYFSAKRRLFDGRASVHVVDVTDAAGRRVAGSAPGRVVTVGLGEGPDVAVIAAETGLARSRFVCRLDGEEVMLNVKLGGLHNVLNAALAAACARQVGIGVEGIVEGLGAIERIPGRLDPVDAGQPFAVLIDYAHTPEAVESVVGAALDHCDGSTIVVLGAAGERDAAKRTLLGAAAAKAHLAVITSDNPRSEDPARLVEAVVAGTSEGRAEVIPEVDRSNAIRLALERARPGDAVLILGKGHERHQDLGDEIVPFDDRAVAMSHLQERWAGGVTGEELMTKPSS